MQPAPIALQESLTVLQKHYDARYPSVPALIPLPASSDLALWETQEWIVDHLIKPEKALQESLLNEVSEEDRQLGCIAWRKAFWKRIIQHIEEGIASSEDPDVGVTRLFRSQP
jgi:hypothetical protein